MAGYYYGQLSKEKKAVYDMLAAGCDALAAVIRVPDLGTEVLSDIYLRMKLDLPLLFFVTGFHYRKMPGADHVEVLPDYLFDRGKVKMHRQAVTARLERLARPLKGKSDREKELARLEKEKAACQKDIDFLSGKLSNAGFVAKAPEKVIAMEREKLAKAEEKLVRIEESIRNLG